jgi:CubicO group peptidase (beta-lactamase class C family)
MRELVLAPIGMSHSTYEEPLSPARAATAATACDESGKSGTAAHFVEPNAAAGGLWTTAVALYFTGDRKEVGGYAACDRGCWPE